VPVISELHGLPGCGGGAAPAAEARRAHAPAGVRVLEESMGTDRGRAGPGRLGELANLWMPPCCSCRLPGHCCLQLNAPTPSEQASERLRPSTPGSPLSSTSSSSSLLPPFSPSCLST